MDKKMKSNKNPLVRFRGWIQAAATLLTNIHIPNLFKGKIYQGNVKTMCVPGLNCYSCPAAQVPVRLELFKPWSVLQNSNLPTTSPDFSSC